MAKVAASARVVHHNLDEGPTPTRTLYPQSLSARDGSTSHNFTSQVPTVYAYTALPTHSPHL